MKTIILHQVNCLGVMNAGFAAYVRRKFPQCFKGYRQFCRGTENPLGKVYIYENEKYIILNMFSQNYYGRRGLYTDYEAMETALQYIRSIYPTETITAPHYIGCGLGGGDWNIVSKILEKYNITTSREIHF